MGKDARVPAPARSGPVPDTADLLSAVVRATAAAPDADAVLERTAQLLTSLAGWVLADRLDDPDLVTRVAAYGPQGPLPLPEGHSGGQRRSAAGAVGLLPQMVASPSRLLRLDEQALRRAAGSEEARTAAQAGLALSLGARELLVVGLVARDAVVGVLTLGCRAPLGERELAVLRDVALHVGQALDAARLLAVQNEVATAMQTSLLPPVPSVPGLRLAARYSPAAKGLDVGGDWYDAFPAHGGLTVVVGDASGHDVVAAARMADLRNLLRAYAVDRDEPPSALVDRLERTADALGLESGATCLVGRLVRQEAGAWQLTWTSAGHLPPVLASGGRAVLVETAADLMLGVQTGSRRTDHVRVLLPGDVLVLCTDGLVEVRGTALEDRLEQLRAAVGRLAGRPPDALADALLREVGDQATDDVALLVLEVPPFG